MSAISPTFPYSAVSSSVSSNESSSEEEDDYSKLLTTVIKSSNKYSKILQQRKLEEEGLSSLDEDGDEEGGQEEGDMEDDFHRYEKSANKGEIGVISPGTAKHEKKISLSSSSLVSEDDDVNDDNIDHINKIKSTATNVDLSKYDLFRLRYLSTNKHNKFNFAEEYNQLLSVKDKKKKKKRKKKRKHDGDDKSSANGDKVVNKKTIFNIGGNKYFYHQCFSRNALSSLQQIRMENKNEEHAESIQNSLVHDFIMKPRLAKQWMENCNKNYKSISHEKSSINKNPHGFSKLQSIIFPSLNNYHDLFLSTRFQEISFPHEITSVLSLHLLNHIIKSRAVITKNNNKIKLAGIASKQRRDEQLIKYAVSQDKNTAGNDDPNLAERQRKKRRYERKIKREQAKEEKFSSIIHMDPEKMPTKLLESDEDHGDNTVFDKNINRPARGGNGMKPNSKSEALGNLRDQGFTRPKVLILLPVRASAKKYVDTILKYLPSTITNVKNKQKFDAEFGIRPENDILDEQGRRKSEYTRDGRRKPEEWIEMFAKNNDDFFRLGMSINRKSCTLYSDFYESDIILASPLGLRLLTGANGQLDDTKHVDSDFLSSIEILILDQACGMLMQNWKHVQDILSLTNVIPSGLPGSNNGDKKNRIDFSRVLPYYLDGMAKYLRQTIVVSSHTDVRFNAIFSKHCRNISGISKLTVEHYGEMNDVVTASKHVFKRIEVDKKTLSNASHEKHFDYFKRKLYPRLKRICQGLDADEEEYLTTQKNTGTLLFIPSYFDYLRIKQLFLKDKLDPGLLCEYTEANKITRERSYFFHGKSRILLYSERFHYYNRYRIRGIKHLIFYAPPLNPNLYNEMCDLVVSSGNSSVSTHGLNTSRDDTDDRPQISTLFTKFDNFQIERIVGTKRYKSLIKGSDDGQDTYVFAFRDSE